MRRKRSKSTEIVRSTRRTPEVQADPTQPLVLPKAMLARLLRIKRQVTKNGGSQEVKNLDLTRTLSAGDDHKSMGVIGGDREAVQATLEKHLKGLEVEGLHLGHVGRKSHRGGWYDLVRAKFVVSHPAPADVEDASSEDADDE